MPCTTEWRKGCFICCCNQRGHSHLIACLHIWREWYLNRTLILLQLAGLAIKKLLPHSQRNGYGSLPFAILNERSNCSLTWTWFLSARCAFYSLPCYHKPFLASLLLYLCVSLWLVSWVGLCTMPYCFLKFWKSHVTAVDLFLNKRLCWSLCCFSLDCSHSPLACISVYLYICIPVYLYTCISNQFPCIQNICEH